KILTRSQSAILHGLGDIEDGIALGDHNRMNIDIPANQALMNVDHVRRFVELIFSGFERALVMKVVPKHERIGTADYSGGLELRCDTAGRIAWPQEHGFLRRRADGHPRGPCQPRS